jgi:hypothetical protein
MPEVFPRPLRLVHANYNKASEVFIRKSGVNNSVKVPEILNFAQAYIS